MPPTEKIIVSLWFSQPVIPNVVMNDNAQLSETAQHYSSDFPAAVLASTLLCLFRQSQTVSWPHTVVESTMCADPLWKVQRLNFSLNLLPSQLPTLQSDIVALIDSRSTTMHFMSVSLPPRHSSGRQPVPYRWQEYSRAYINFMLSIAHASVLTEPPQSKHVCNISYVLVLSDKELMNTITIIINFQD